MKKISAKFSLIFFILLGLSISRNASAQLPFAASFDFGGEIQGIVQDIQAALKTVETNVVGRIKDTLGKLQAAYDQYAGKITKVFDKIPGTKDFKIGGHGHGSSGGSNYQSVDIYNAEAVKATFVELFLTYPSDEKRVQIAYDNMSNKFYYDTLIEVKASITSLEEQLDKLRKEVDNFSEQAMSGSGGEGGGSSSAGGESDGAASSEDDSGIIYNAYLSNRKFNDILKVTEEVVALQNQYYAAKLLRRPRQIEAEQPSSSGGQSSSLYFHKQFDNAQFLKKFANIVSGSEEKTTVNDVSNKTSTEKATSDNSKAATITNQVTTSTGKTVNAVSQTSELSKGVDYSDKSSTLIRGVDSLDETPTLKTVDSISKTPELIKETDSSNEKLTEKTTYTDSTSPDLKNYTDSLPNSYYSTSADDDFFEASPVPETSSPLKHSQAELNAINAVSEAQELVTKAEEVHNLLQQLPSYQDTFKQYELIKQLHNVAVAAVSDADQCVIKYLRTYYQNPNRVWYGQNTVPAQICDYDNRGGLSGWAITMYQLANAASGNNIDANEMTKPTPGVEDGDPDLVEVDTEKLDKRAENFTVSEIDPDDPEKGYSDSVRETDPEKLTAERDGDKEKLEDNFADSDKAKEFSNSSREVSLINWQIGKQAAHELVKDQDNPNHPVYGAPSNPYPLWNDQRSYYDQYISGKYNNMKAYIRQLNVSSATLQIIEMINNEVEDEEERLANESDIIQLENAIEDGVGITDQLGSLLQAKNNAIASLKQQEKNVISTIQSALTQTQKNIDSWTGIINDANKTINELNESNTLHRGTMESSSQSMSILEKRGMSLLSSLFSQAKQALQEAAEKISSIMSRVHDLRVTVKNATRTRDQAKAHADLLKQQVEELTQEYQIQIQGIESNFDRNLDELQASLETPTMENVYTAANINNESLYAIVASVDGLINQARECAAQLIDEHLNSLKLSAAGDVLYKASNHHNLIVQHIQLINQLKNLPESCLTNAIEAQSAALNLAIPSSVISKLQTIFQEAITQEICSQYSCDTPDGEYFVGLPAKARDFTAPKAASDQRYPTVRDVFHFDTTDYKNIKMTQDGELTREALLETGAALPEIWQLLLSDRAFVEKGIDLAAVLNKGDEGKAFMRGYMLPCRIFHNNTKYIIDIDVNHNKEKYAVVNVTTENTQDNISRYNNLSDCRELEIGAHALGLYTIKDTDVKDNLLGNNSADSIEDPVSSELGMLLKYSNYRLSINDDARDGFDHLIEKEKKAEKKGKYELKARGNIYQRAMFTKNQIGDFLHFMDKEKSAKEKLDEAEADIADLRVTLKEALSALGFAIADDINLARDEDYAEVVQKLQTSKNMIMGQAMSKINIIDHSNPDVDERYQKVNNTYMALAQDNKALVNITDTTEAGAALAESIKSEEANKKVVEKSRSDGYKALLDEINNYEKPICIPNGTILPSYMNATSN